MRDMTRDEIDRIKAGTVGVTPGPWARTELDRFATLVTETERSNTVLVVPWQRGVHGSAHRDAAHIANCDPDTIAALCDLAIAGLAAGEVAEPVAWRTVEDIPRDGTSIDLLLSSGREVLNAHWGVSDEADGWLRFDGFWARGEGEEVIGWRPIEAAAPIPETGESEQRGMVLVPREPTEAMLQAGEDAFVLRFAFVPANPWDAVGSIFAAMIAAAGASQ